MRRIRQSFVLTAVAATTLAVTSVANADAGNAAAPASANAVGKAAGRATKVIVLLANQHTATPATRAHLSARRAALKSDQAPLRAQISRLGGRTTKSFSTLNAVAATVPSGGVATLRSYPGVRAVVPDLPIRMAQPAAPEATGSGTSTGAGNSAGARYCPTNPNKPQLEPEALSLIHADSDVAGAKTARSLGYTGAGVTVGFIADGTDVDQPDLIRPDGSHVVTDYQDFSGDGTDASTSGAEAMGDVSSIAAQGRTSYDISKFVNAAHPLPTGCNIRIEGVAPGANVVALKVFSNNLLTAPTSTIVQAIDYAINVDHVNVLNESFGSNPYPDNATDPISLANQDAVDAGIAVTASTGDSGSGNTLGTASTDPNVIAAAASTSERVYAQTGNYGFPLSNGKYTSDQVSGLSSGGISQTNRVPDLMAPGDLNWSLCSNKLLPDGSPQYYSCSNYADGGPSNIQVFGGTSESAPLTAGAAALVFQAYRAGHDGQNPTPAQVRTILTSTANDLGEPAEIQGAGLLDTYRAVRLAKDYRSSSPSSTEVSASVPQVSNVQAPGPVTNQISITNQGTRAQRVSASVRQVSHVFKRQVQNVPFNPNTAPTFLDALGRVRPYAVKTFTVPAGTDRLDAAVSVAGDGTRYVRATLLKPDGTFAAYTLPQGTGNYGHIDVHQPVAGTWTAIVWSSSAAASVSGPIKLITRYFHATSAGSVTPSSAVFLTPGATQTFSVTTTVPDSEASAASVVFTHRGGETTTVSVVNRAVQQVAVGSPATFSGTFDQANGRDFSPAQSVTYLVDVPSGAKDLDVDASISGVPANHIIAHLSDPTGEPVSTGRNILPDGSSYSGLQLVHADPIPGRYQLTLELENQSSGAALPQTFSGSFSLNGAQVSATGVPQGGISASGTDATVHVTNTSPVPQTYFVDGRTTATRTYPLVTGDVAGDAPDSADPYSRTVRFPLASDNIVPAWLVPTQVSSLSVSSQASRPVTFDLMPLNAPTTLNAPNNPDTESTVRGRTATATHAAPEVGSTQWAAFPTVVGPIGTNPATGRVTMKATAVARGFDQGVTSSTGDPLLSTVDAKAPAATPVTIQPGRSADITVHFTAQGSGTHRGTLFVDIAQPYGPLGYSTLTEEVAALPYSYTAGSSTN